MWYSAHACRHCLGGSILLGLGRRWPPRHRLHHPRTRAQIGPQVEVCWQRKHAKKAVQVDAHEQIPLLPHAQPGNTVSKSCRWAAAPSTLCLSRVMGSCSVAATVHKVSLGKETPAISTIQNLLEAILRK